MLTHIGNISFAHQQWTIVHDGSYLHNTAAYSWQICYNYRCLLTGQGSAPGNPSSAFRAELFGMVAWYCALYHITKYYGISPTAHLTPYSDNIKLIHYHKHVIKDTVPLCL